MAAAVQGFLLCAGLLIAIGSQAVYVLDHGLRKQHVFLVCSVCFTCDIVLISVGVMGVGSQLLHLPEWRGLITGLSCLFMLGYGVNSLYQAFRLHIAQLADSATRFPVCSWKITLLGVLTVTLLNPHVYLDTLLLIGGFGAQLASEQKGPYMLGALCASFLWFFGLGYGARYLAQYVRKRNTQLYVHVFMAGVMFLFAGQLYASS